MFRIGQFSKLSHVSVKTLRYYDQIGLLRPATVDRFTSYRYYTADQLTHLNRILLLKDLGLSLDQIGQVLERGLPVSELRGMLRLKEAELRQQVEQEQQRLGRIAAWLNHLENEEKMPDYEYILKDVPTVRVAAVRDVVPDYPAQGTLWNELGDYIKANNLKLTGDPCFTIEYDEEHKDSDVDLEVCEVVDVPLLDAGRVQVRDLPPAHMVSTIHKGPFSSLPQAYGALMEWVQANGYRICGPNREIYIQNPGNEPDPNKYVTEIQFPVEKA